VDDEQQIERRALVASIVATGVLGALGVVWGIATRSQMILLDGVYAVIGIALSLLLLRASTVARSLPTDRFPYGRESVTPLAIGIQGTVLLGTLLYAGVEAVATVREGGSEVAAGSAVLYGAIATVSSVAVWRWLRAQQEGSDVLVAEAAAWGVASLRGVGMVIGFSLIAVLSGSSWDDVAPYVDPAMVLITCVAFAGIPARMVRTTVLELLEGAPGPDVQEPVHAAIEAVRQQFDLPEVDLAMSKVGSKLYVEVDADVDPTVTVAQEQEVRDALRDRLEALPYDVWLNLELHPRT
jgi:cation diffusion facilitator family transporter